MRFLLQVNEKEVSRTFQFNTWQAMTDLILHNNAIAELQQEIVALREEIAAYNAIRLGNPSQKPKGQKPPSETM